MTRNISLFFLSLSLSLTAKAGGQLDYNEGFKDGYDAGYYEQELNQSLSSKIGSKDFCIFGGERIELLKVVFVKQPSSMYLKCVETYDLRKNAGTNENILVKQQPRMVFVELN